MNKRELENGLLKYIPEPTVPLLAAWVIDYNIHLRISRSRSSKLGDYRPPQQGHGHRISINHNLNPYAFLVTLVHEIAHLTCWNSYQNRVEPHGKEWKMEYQKLMVPVIELGIFPEDVHLALMSYLRNPAASSCTDTQLQKTLSRYDENPVIHLDDIPEGARFQLVNGMVMTKGEKRRTRYRCQAEHNQRFYLVSGVAEVELL
ncbi:MAG: sprT domain-containing protein [Bacteroidetes bacterium]|nr:MAG: sprT domain-containing protein [Bacteroidota bacterium]